MTIPLTTVDEILRSLDIEGLLAVGAPSDEYGSEAEQIKNLLEGVPETQMSRKEVLAIVTAVWEHSFGPFSAEELQNRAAVLQQLTDRVLDPTAPVLACLPLPQNLQQRL